MSKRKHRTNLARIRNNDWCEGGDKRGMDKSKPNHFARELNGVRIGRRRNGVVRYTLSNKKGESLKLEILHLLRNKEFVLKKERRIEALSDGYGLLHTWREKGIVSSEGDIQDIRTDLLLQGERIFI